MSRLLLLLIFAPLLFGQNAEIRTMLEKSEAAWNHGDLEAFASDYEDSPQTTFIGREVTHGGRKAIVDRYRKGYPTREAMGTLHFSEIEVRGLAPGLAVANGKWHIQRSGGGESAGRFTLILRKSPAGWKILHDHSS